MRLNQHTDYALRVLVFLACHAGERVTTRTISAAFDVSHTHLQKVVRSLGELGVVVLHRGRNGGLELQRDPANISVGAVVRALEEGQPLVECFDSTAGLCVIAPACALRGALSAAREAFYAALDDVTIAAIVRGRKAGQLRHLLEPR